MKRLLILFLLMLPMAGFSQTDSVCHRVATEASFPGGAPAMHKWLAEHMLFPAETVGDQTNNRIYASFSIEADGSISQLRIRPTSSPDLDRHVAGVIKSMPRWTPAQLNGEPVRSHYTLPVIVDLK